MIKQRLPILRGVVAIRTPIERILFEKDWDRRYKEGLNK